MAQDKQPFEALSETAEKARGAMDDYLSFLRNMCSPDLTEKMKTYTAQNISASADCAQKLSQAKDFQEVFRIQTEFMQMQLNSFAEQAGLSARRITKQPRNVTKPFERGVTVSA